MVDSVLVAFDGSPLAERALRHALETHPEAAVTTIHVIDPIEAVYAAETGGITVAEEWDDEARRRADAIHDAAREVTDEFGVELETVTAVGRPGREILEYADEHDVDAIVMGSHGRAGVDRLLLGSVAETVLRRARDPVTVVR